jgi:hypothetical protein
MEGSAVRNGYPFYGQNIGVLVFDGASPRVPGDPGHAASFDYQVRYEVVNGCPEDLVEGSEKIKKAILDACLSLKRSGVRGIVGDCGLISLYQRELASGVGIPVAASSLVLIPSVWQMIGRAGTIGILTGHSGFLRRSHLESSGCDGEMNIRIWGMQEEPHFLDVVINGGSVLDTTLMRRDVLNACAGLTASTQDLRAVIVECGNLATYSADIAEVLDIPVFDVMSAANLLECAINPRRYP